MKRFSSERHEQPSAGPSTFFVLDCTFPPRFIVGEVLHAALNFGERFMEVTAVFDLAKFGVAVDCRRTFFNGSSGERFGLSEQKQSLCVE